jgi:hypothetical protein
MMRRKLLERVEKIASRAIKKAEERRKKKGREPWDITAQVTEVYIEYETDSYS